MLLKDICALEQCHKTNTGGTVYQALTQERAQLYSVLDTSYMNHQELVKQNFDEYYNKPEKMLAISICKKQSCTYIPKNGMSISRDGIYLKINK